MSDKVLNLNDGDFEAEIKKGVVLVDFWAPWCGPCRTQGPIVELVAGKIGDKAKVAKVNIDEAPNTAVKLGIRNIPTLILFKNGEAVHNFAGVQRASVLIAAIDGAQ